MQFSETGGIFCCPYFRRWIRQGRICCGTYKLRGSVGHASTGVKYIYGLRLVQRIINNQPYHLSDFPATALDFLAVATATPSKICLVSEKSSCAIQPDTYYSLYQLDKNPISLTHDLNDCLFHGILLFEFYSSDFQIFDFFIRIKLNHQQNPHRKFSYIYHYPKQSLQSLFYHQSQFPVFRPVFSY